MSPFDDDLSAFGDDPIFRALSGPGSAEELAGESAALEAFRSAVPVRNRRRLAGRLGIAGSALTIGIALSGGVAAAYSGALPTPVQRVFHDAVSWTGIPAPVSVRHGSGGSNAATTAASRASSGGGGGTAGLPPVTATTPAAPPPPTSGAHPSAAKPKPKASDHTTPAAPTASTTPTPTDSPSASSSSASSPSPSPSSSSSDTPAPPASITISLSANRVSAGTSVNVYGQVSAASGAPIAGQTVWLLQRLAGQHSLSEVASGTTNAQGTVELDSPVLTQSVRLRLATDPRLRSASLPVIVVPTISVAVQASSTPGMSSVEVTTSGAQPGDDVVVIVRGPTGWRLQTQTQLDAQGATTFEVPTPPKRSAHYRVVLSRTPEHSRAVAPFLVEPA